MTAAVELPPPAAHAIEVWLSHHDRLAPGLVEGLYLVGSLAFDDWSPRSDIDVVAFTSEPATDTDVERLLLAHEAARADVEVDVDGPYLAWGDVTMPPLAAHRPWTLHDEFHHDGECFEINPVTWCTLATRGIAVRGPAPDELSVHLDPADRASWVRENVDTYWRSVLDQISAALAADPARDEFDGAVVEWSALGIARMAYTLETGAVTSKTAAGRWAADRFPAHSDALGAAVEIRRASTVGPVGRDLVGATVELLTELVASITS